MITISLLVLAVLRAPPTTAAEVSPSPGIPFHPLSLLLRKSPEMTIGTPGCTRMVLLIALVTVVGCENLVVPTSKLVKPTTSLMVSPMSVITVPSSMLDFRLILRPLRAVALVVESYAVPLATEVL